MNHKKSDATSYVAQFRVHQKFVQAHLEGTLNDEHPLLPAFFPPSSYWRSDEKDLFFHGLAVYSRFRPDLIAESIKTKTIFDVCLYLDILQRASSRVHSEIHESFRSSLEPAMEVSSTWIENEEQLATELTQFDSCTLIPESAEGQLGEVDSTAVPSSPTPESFEQPATQVEGSSNLDSHESLVIASESMSADTVQLVVAILKEFVSEVVRGSLISKEQEVRLKSTLKVWRHDQNKITVKNVRETLKSMGIAHSNLKNYSAKLVEEDSIGISAPDRSINSEMGIRDDNNGDGTDDQDEDEDESSNEGNPSNASDASSQPLTKLWLPQSLRRFLLPKYNWVSENEDDDILPEIDEIEIQRELKEEEGLDARDLLASKEYEAELWVP